MKNQSITIADTTIRQDQEGRYCLTDLHKSAGGENKHRAKYWLENQQAKELISELESTGGIPPVVINNGGSHQGTFVCKELVYAYAMWISAAFHLKVIRAYDAMVTTPRTDVAKRVKSAINARAWALAHSNYDAYRGLMLSNVSLDDPASEEAARHWNPPEMLPSTVIDEAITALNALKRK